MVSRAEHSELLSAMRAMRSENARLEARIEKLESERVLGTRAAAPKPVALNNSAATNSTDALPPLAVVKLKPKREAAPPLDTRVEVAEPALYTDEPPQKPSEPDEADLSIALAQFEAAEKQLKTGDTEGGVAAMRQFAAEWPRHPKADNALYLSGAALHVSRDYEQAAGLFQRVIAQYPAGDAVLDSMLKLADCQARLKQAGQARATWEKIVSNYPGTAAANQASAKLASNSSAVTP